MCIRDRILHPDLWSLIGAPEEFGSIVAGAGPDAAPRRAKYHAMLARVLYLDTKQVSWILFVKPSLTGDEPADLLQYQGTHPDFPQESTMDQYFDEAQWESYRKLGDHIGRLLFAPCRQGRAGWSPRDMCAPPEAAAERET